MTERHPPTLFVALDLEPAEIEGLVERLPAGAAYKVGMESFYRDGAALIRGLTRRGHRIFLDLKLHDIPNTVARATDVVAGYGVDSLTVHAGGGPDMMCAAVDAAAGRVEVWAVTLLTSLTGDEFGDLWTPASSPESRVLGLAEMAIDAGCHGVISSPREAGALRRALGPATAIICPGIRPGADGGEDDQKRTATPRRAIEDGASHLVVGRPITRAADPAAAYRAIRAEMDQAAPTRL